MMNVYRVRWYNQGRACDLVVAPTAGDAIDAVLTRFNLDDSMIQSVKEIGTNITFYQEPEYEVAENEIGAQ